MLKIIGECKKGGICDGDTAPRLVRLVKAIEDYLSGTIDRRHLLDILRMGVLEVSTSELAMLVIRELCDERVLEEIEEWARDPEPRIRLAYLKCATKLYDEGRVNIERLLPFKDDPSPKVRKALVSSLSRYASRDDVFALLSSMLGAERRSSVRSEILLALSSVMEEDRSKEKRGLWGRIKRRLLNEE